MGGHITQGVSIFLALFYMDNSFFAYLQQLELMAFFSGYPMLYAVVFFVAGNRQLKKNTKARLVVALPLSYALVGTLFLGFQLKKLYPDYSLAHIHLSVQQPWLVVWGLLAVLFWVPYFAKKTVWSLLHSVIFFFFLLKDFVLQSSTTSDGNIIANDMKMYTASLMLNLCAFAVTALLYFLIIYLKKRQHS